MGFDMLRKLVVYDPETGKLTTNNKYTTVVYAKGNNMKISSEIPESNGIRATVHGAKLCVRIHLDCRETEFSVSFVDKTLPRPSRHAWKNLRVKSLSATLVIPTEEAERPNKPETDGNMGCIYLFYNIATKMHYIGQSVNPEDRLKSHIAQAFKHGGAKFQKALAYYGMVNFAFSVIRDCPKDELDYWECYYIDQYDSYNNGYNSTRGNGRAAKKKSKKPIKRK